MPAPLLLSTLSRLVGPLLFADLPPVLPHQLGAWARVNKPTAGLLSTEAGTLGRFVGNGLLAGAGKLTGLASLSQMAAFARLLFLCLAAACVALLGQLACTYRRLQG